MTCINMRYFSVLLINLRIYMHKNKQDLHFLQTLLVFLWVIHASSVLPGVHRFCCNNNSFYLTNSFSKLPSLYFTMFTPLVGAFSGLPFMS